MSLYVTGDLISINAKTMQVDGDSFIFDDASERVPVYSLIENNGERIKLQMDFVDQNAVLIKKAPLSV